MEIETFNTVNDSLRKEHKIEIVAETEGMV